MNETVTRTAVFDAPAHDVWSALTRPDELGDWFGEILELELRPRGRIAERDRDGAVWRGLVEAIEPERRLAIRWRRYAEAEGTPTTGPARRVEFVLEPEGERTRVTVIESPEALVAPVAMGDR